MATMLADQEVLRLFSAIYYNDLDTIKDVVQRGLDPKHVQFVIRKFFLFFFYIIMLFYSSTSSWIVISMFLIE